MTSGRVLPRGRPPGLRKAARRPPGAGTGAVGWQARPGDTVWWTRQTAGRSTSRRGRALCGGRSHSPVRRGLGQSPEDEDGRRQVARRLTPGAGRRGQRACRGNALAPQVPQDPWRLLTERSAHPPWVRGSARDVHPTERGPCATEACRGVAAAGSTAPNWDNPAPEPVRLTGQGSQDRGTAEPPARRQSPLSRRAASLGPAWGAGRAAPARACGPVRGLP